MDCFRLILSTPRSSWEWDHTALVNVWPAFLLHNVLEVYPCHHASVSQGWVFYCVHVFYCIPLTCPGALAGFDFLAIVSRTVGKHFCRTLLSRRGLLDHLGALFYSFIFSLHFICCSYCMFVRVIRQLSKACLSFHHGLWASDWHG